MRYQGRPLGARVFGRWGRAGPGLPGGSWALLGGGSALTMPRKGVEAVVGAAGAAANSGPCTTLMQAQMARWLNAIKSK